MAESGHRLSVAGRLREHPVSAYGLAIGSATAALVVRLSLDGVFPPGFPFLTFFPAIIVTSFFAGARPGSLCAFLSLLAAWYFLIPRLDSFALAPGTITPLLFFVAVSAVDIILIHAMQQALDRLDAERQLTARLYDQQRNLFAELQHRVANNMAFIAGLLRLQKRRVAREPESAAQAFDEAVTRIDTMGRIHRRLYDPTAVGKALAVHLQTVCEELLQATGNTRITCKVEVPDMQLGLERLVPLSLLVAEVVTNSLKHAFPDGARGTITVTVEPAPEGDRVLVIRDDGIGLPAGHDPGASRGLGMRIVDGLAAQMGGHISMASEGGAVTRVHLPT
ncbi:sensor histidine kinase [Polymorphobacter glacialis]|uniref:histidine kinase n=1 Tax=Sandarakinorhabdus glacialis TaxID=1614636 RepID=A0A916ZRP0_9SPHN|nr:histidine kinase dimerization/phosphoacceptor domain -containing protein [Polymorphobacter glacialis]GGE10842.1 sensor histidine kinase [Polymorphobacter glacialis]